MRASRGRLLLLPLLLPGAAPSLSAQSAPQRYELDAARSHLYVVTHRSGLLSFLGHEHAILVRDWEGEICWAPAAPAGARGRIAADARTLVIDSDSARALAGLGGGPSPRQVEGIQRKLLDVSHLAAESHPEIRLDSLEVLGAEGDQLAARAVLTIRGISREVTVGIRFAPAAASSFRLSGRLRVSQREFGISPESIAGVVRVADQVDIHFDLLAVPAEEPCS